MLPATFDPFVKAAPFCVLARAALESLFQPQRLDELFRRTAQHQYTRQLLFSQLVELMISVVLRQQPSVHAAFRNKLANITVSHQALYDKLDQLELCVSAALVRDSADHLTPVIDELQARQSSWLVGWQVKVVDGNTLSSTQRRLSELRDIWDAPMPGKVLAVYDQQTDLVTNVFLTPDGHAQEASLLSDVLETVEARDVWIADRNFCTLAFLCGLAAQDAAFVIRQHGRLHGRLLGSRRCVGRCETGELYEQQIEVQYQTQSYLWRRVSVELDKPTRDGDREIHILTNLPTEAADAAQVALLYRKRWTIEGVFYEVAQTLNCEPHTLAYPPAALFCFCLALLAFNAVALCKAAMRSSAGEESVEQLSVYYVALEIQQTHSGMMVALPAESWEFVRQLSIVELAQLLKQVASQIDQSRYRKAKRGPKKPPPARKAYKNGGHISTHKLLQKRKPQAP